MSIKLILPYLTLAIMVSVLSFNSAIAQKIPVIKISDLIQEYEKSNDTLYVVNFWATWCLPCVKELPAFEQLQQNYGKQKMKLILVSLDFKQELHKLERFVLQKKLSPKVVLLDEPKYHEWIDKVEPNWGGSIPATLVIKNKGKYKSFSEKALDYESLSKIVESGFSD